jgi:hypothetical protein
MPDSSLIKRNLLALSSHHPDLAARLTACQPSEKITYITSKTQVLIPCIEYNNRIFPFHSKFDPVHEGRRLVEATQNAGYIVILGLGAGYHIIPFIEEDSISQILILEKNLCYTRSIIEQIDLSGIFLSPKIKLLIDSDQEEVMETILNHYLPVLSGNLKTISLKSRINLDQSYFSIMFKAIKNVIERIADDYTVQAQFGKLWFTNTLNNLPYATDSTLTLRPQSKVLITGAGPSLEGQIKRIKKMRKEACLIASDTSLSALLKEDIFPDLVLSIDCQKVTYHHFIQAYPEEIPLVLDLASPVILNRLTTKRLFFSSGHPFSQYVSNHLRPFPVLDTSGGNVSHTALSLAYLLGAKDIYLFGIDFSYPDGKSYARGTYLYPYFKTSENRFSPLESQFISFLFRNTDILKEKTGSTYRYTTKPMINYKERMEKLIRELKLNVIHIKGKGIPLKTFKMKNRKKNSINSILSQGICKKSYKDFLKEYLKCITMLPEPFLPIGIYLEKLSVNERDLWMTQLPAAAALTKYYSKQLNEQNINVVELLHRVKKWTLERITQYI